MLKNIVLASVVATLAACSANSDSVAQSASKTCKGNGYEASVSNKIQILSPVQDTLSAAGEIKGFDNSQSTLLFRNAATKRSAQLDGSTLSLAEGNEIVAVLNCR